MGSRKIVIKDDIGIFMCDLPVGGRGVGVNDAPIRMAV